MEDLVDLFLRVALLRVLLDALLCDKVTGDNTNPV